MNSYQNMIDRIVELVCSDMSVGKNYILIGDNASGKSEILRRIVEKKLGQAIYFIDSLKMPYKLF